MLGVQTFCVSEEGRNIVLNTIKEKYLKIKYGKAY